MCCIFMYSPLNLYTHKVLKIKAPLGEPLSISLINTKTLLPTQLPAQNLAHIRLGQILTEGNMFGDFIAR